MCNAKELWQLFSVFFKIGIGTFGGGLAMLPGLEREVVDKRKWLTQEQLYDYYAIGQSTPGIIAVNVATFTGYTRGGMLGSVVATAGIVCPALIIITIIAAFFENFSHIDWVQKALSGINVAVAVLVSFTLAKMMRRTFTSALAAAIAIASFLLMLILGLDGVFIVIASAAIGIAAKYRKMKAGEGGERADGGESGAGGGGGGN